MQQNLIDAARAAFEFEMLQENIIDDEGLERDDDTGEYIDEPAAAAWKAWQLASSRAAHQSRVVTAQEYEDVLADQRRLVRELDVLINGEAGAAKQAKLCDIVAQLEHRRAAITAAEAAQAVAVPEGWSNALWRYGFRHETFGLRENGPYVLLEQVEMLLAAVPVEVSGGVSEWRNAVKALMDTAKAKEKECDGPDAPGHGHRVPGLWDATGKPCDWCAAWSRLRSMLL